MPNVISTPLPEVGQPFSWATRAAGVVFTTQGPVHADGSIDTGPIEQQARLTFDNLRLTIAAAGCAMTDVAQVLVYLTEAGDHRIVDEVYRNYFSAPYPNRSTMIVKALVVPGMKIEIVAYAATS